MGNKQKRNARKAAKRKLFRATLRYEQRAKALRSIGLKPTLRKAGKATAAQKAAVTKLWKRFGPFFNGVRHKFFPLTKKQSRQACKQLPRAAITPKGVFLPGPGGTQTSKMSLEMGDGYTVTTHRQGRKKRINVTVALSARKLAIDPKAAVSEAVKRARKARKRGKLLGLSLQVNGFDLQRHAGGSPGDEVKFFFNYVNDLFSNLVGPNGEQWRRENKKKRMTAKKFAEVFSVRIAYSATGRPNEDEEENEDDEE